MRVEKESDEEGTVPYPDLGLCSVVSMNYSPMNCSPRLLCPWNFPDKNTGVRCHFLLQGIFLGSNPHGFVIPALAGGLFPSAPLGLQSYNLVYLWVFPLVVFPETVFWQLGSGNSLELKKRANGLIHAFLTCDQLIIDTICSMKKYYLIWSSSCSRTRMTK